MAALNFFEYRKAFIGFLPTNALPPLHYNLHDNYIVLYFDFLCRKTKITYSPIRMFLTVRLSIVRFS